MRRNERIRKHIEDALGAVAADGSKAGEVVQQLLCEINEEIQDSETLARLEGIKEAVAVAREGSHKICVMIDSDECIYCGQ